MRWFLEQEELPYREEYCPVTPNNTADYLSRIPQLGYETSVNDEEPLENKISNIEEPKERRVRILDEQRHDPVTNSSLVFCPRWPTQTDRKAFKSGRECFMV